MHEFTVTRVTTDVDIHRKCTYGKCAHLPKWLGKVHIIYVIQRLGAFSGICAHIVHSVEDCVQNFLE